MRRAKEFSEELRKTARILKANNYLMVCSNQIRESMESVGYKYKSPGGQAIGFYSSVRLRAVKTDKIQKKKTIHGTEAKKVQGVRTEFEVFKNSVWKPYRKAYVTIDFDYGVDDIRENLQFIKDYNSFNYYTLDGQKLDPKGGLDASVRMIEEDDLEMQLKEEVIDLWEYVESKFKVERKKKQR
jgi:RecA/RadA recombinase